MKLKNIEQIEIMLKEKVDSYNWIVQNIGFFYSQMNDFNKNPYENFELGIKSVQNALSQLLNIVEGANMWLSDSKFVLEKNDRIAFKIKNTNIPTNFFYTYYLQLRNK